MPRRDVWRIERFARHEVDHVPHSHSNSLGDEVHEEKHDVDATDAALGSV